MSSSIGYRPEIDGLRAFAVIPVILFHMGISQMAGGYIGVDVFFVLSGFLITSIIKKELEAGTFSLREFWARRVRRIVPALLVVTVATLVVTWLFTFRPHQAVTAKEALAALLSLANVHFWQTSGDYWGVAAEQSPLLHTWSLSVEEQFYLFFPLTMWLIFRFRPRWLQGVIIAMAAVSLALFLYGTNYDSTATFYLLPTRVWELATGCLLAVVWQNQKTNESHTNISAALGLSGLALVVGSYFLYPTLGAGLIVAVLGTALIITYGQTGLCQAILAQRHIVHVGKLSYSLYLWHWPVLVFAKQFEFQWHLLTLLIPIFLLALASYHFVEKPTRRKPGIIPAIAVSMLLTASAAMWLIQSPRYYDTTAFAPAEWIPNDCHPNPDNTDAWQIQLGTSIVEASAALPDAYKNGGIISNVNTTPQVVVLGDSHGCMWSDTIATATKNLDFTTSIWVMDGVPPFVSLPLNPQRKAYRLSAQQKYDFDCSRLDLIKEWQPRLVVICRRWDNCSEAETEPMLNFLEENAGQVLLIEQPPILGISTDHNAMQYLCHLGVTPEPGVNKYVPISRQKPWEAGRQLIRKLAMKHKNCHVLPTSDLYVDKSRALVLEGKHVLYLDDDHLVAHGARKILPRLQQAMVDAIQHSDESKNDESARLVDAN